jgi:hypothetical protein
MKNAVSWDVTPCGSLRIDVSEEHPRKRHSLKSIRDKKCILLKVRRNTCLKCLQRRGRMRPTAGMMLKTGKLRSKMPNCTGLIRLIIRRSGICWRVLGTIPWATLCHPLMYVIVWRTSSTCLNVFLLLRRFSYRMLKRSIFVLFVCGLAVRVRGYRTRGPGFAYLCYQIWVIVGLERGPLSLVRITAELFEWKINGSGLENRDYRPWVSVALATRH